MRLAALSRSRAAQQSAADSASDTPQNRQLVPALEMTGEEPA